MGQPFHHQIRIRYAECDAQARVFNAHFLTYFDTTITELYRAAIGNYDQLVARGVDIVVAYASCTFHAPARFDELLDVAVSVEHLGTTSLRSRFDCTVEDRPVVTGELLHVCVEATSFQKTPVPDWLRAALEPYRVDPPDNDPTKAAPSVAQSHRR